MSTHGIPSLPAVSTFPAVHTLVEKAQAGEILAWHALFHRFRDDLARECIGRIPRALRSRFDSDDVIQSAFMSAFEHIQEFEYRGDGSFRAWMRCILDNSLRDGIKFHCRAMRSPSAERHAADNGADLIPANRRDRPDEQIGLQEDQHRVRLAVAHLPLGLREIVEMRVEHGWTWNEIAFRLDCSPTTARRRVQLALDHIQHELHPLACS